MSRKTELGEKEISKQIKITRKKHPEKKSSLEEKSLWKK